MPNHGIIARFAVAKKVTIKPIQAKARKRLALEIQQ